MSVGLSRRSFLGLLLAWSLSATARSRASGKKVIVVGAGLAGLGAAKALTNAGIEATVLEARKRAGGRVWTDRSLGAPVDMGAAWIHGVSGNPIQKLTSGLKTVPTNYESVSLWSRRDGQMSASEVGSLFLEADGLLGEMAQWSGSQLRDHSFQRALTAVLEGEILDPEESQALDWWLKTMTTTTGADLDGLSLWGDGQEESFPGGDVLFPGGFDGVINRLSSGLSFHFEQVVSHVRQDMKSVVVTTQDKDWRADACLVTLPVGVLRKKSVGFTPGLPGPKQDAVDRIGLSVLNKVAFRFPRVFWPKDRDFLGWMSEGSNYFLLLNGAKLFGEPILVSMGGGSYARDMESRAVEKVMAMLKSTVGQGPAPTSWKATRWHDDPYAGCSYTHLKPGQTGELYDRLAEPFGRVYFAGEHTSRRYPSTTHGALESGRRAAREIIQVLK